MRKLVFAVVLALMSMLCVVAAPTQAAVVGVSEAHMTIDVPAGWTWVRNDTSTGASADLKLTSPASGGYSVIGLIETEAWSGSVTSAKLYDTLKSSIESSGITVSSYAVAPRNITINGLKACDATINALSGSVAVTERITISASDPWNMGYILVFAGVPSVWSTYSSSVDSCIMSLTVEAKASSGGLGTTTLLAILVVVIVVVVIVLVVLMMRRKKPEAAPMPPPGTPGTPPSPPQAP